MLRANPGVRIPAIALAFVGCLSACGGSYEYLKTL